MAQVCQFIHFSLYGMAPRRREPAWACVDGITREGARAPGATRHLSYPVKPRVLFGVQPLAAATLAAGRAIEAVDAIGRRLRCDGAVLLAVVASYPVPRAIIAERGRSEERALYSRWLNDTVTWLRQQFGATLVSVVEHVDEDYLHIHAYAVPTLGPDRLLQWELIHPGRAALRGAISTGQDKSGQRRAYVEAMRSWQDGFHAAVSAKYDHARFGPRRQRQKRTEYLLNREAERKEAEREQVYKQKRADMRSDVKNELIEQYGQHLAEARWELLQLKEAMSKDSILIDQLKAQIELDRVRICELNGDGISLGG